MVHVFEVWDYDIGHGSIGLATSSDGLNWNYDQNILSDSVHLSYPLVLKYAGSHYMIPESHQANEVRVYESGNFPYDWTLVSTILTGVNLVDSSIFLY